MVAGTQQQHQQQQQGATTFTSSSAPPSAEEEALKRNIDCVYFLASPLTCKKGSECEYRHSEYARVNPMDCWFWLNGNCLNPKCSFRHPPLDGLLGTQMAASAGSSLASSQTAVTPATHAPHNSGKQSVPCIFFQKGFCLKGDRCSFFHGPNSTSNKAPQAPAATPGVEPLTLKKTFGGLEKCTQGKQIPQASILKSVELPPVPKLAPKTETDLPRNEVGIERNIPPPTGLVDELTRYKAANVPPVVNENSVSRSNRYQTTVQNGKDADEFLRESSPGFDVLVDDELLDSDYYHSEDQYGITRGHEGRNLNSLDEYDIGHSADYRSMADGDREMLRESRGYDSYDRVQGRYAWEQQRASSERMLGGAAHLERRGYQKAESPDRFAESDLRHRLSKQRVVNGLRSVVSHDFALENHVEEQNYQGSSRRESTHLPSHESTLSSRLRGRIKLPGRSSVVDGSDFGPEREMDRRRNSGRLSPGRPQSSLHQGRLRDRIKGRVQEDYNNEEKNIRGPRMRREVLDDRNYDFVAPKRLAELKVMKNAENKEHQSIGKRRNLMIEDHPQSVGDLSFEGPKPLSVILKRKRESEGVASGDGLYSVNKEENNQKESKESLISSSKTTVTGTQSDLPTTSEEETKIHVIRNKEESKSATANAVETEEKTEAAYGQSSQVRNVNERETEDGMMVDETMEDPVLEDVDQRDGDYDYEQGDEGDYNFEGGENADLEEEYLEDEDGDDFAKKIGVMFA